MRDARAQIVSTFVRKMLSTFVGKTSQLARRDGRDGIGRQRNGSTKCHSGKIPQVRLTNNTTKNRKFTDYIHGKGRNDGCRALVGAVEHPKKPATVAGIWSTGTITAQKSIVLECSMRFKFRSLDCFCCANDGSLKRTRTRLCALTNWHSWWP